jgi:hypothetical protein
VGHPQGVLLGQVLAEVLGVNFDGAEPAEHTEAQEPAKGPAGERFG